VGRPARIAFLLIQAIASPALATSLLWDFDDFPTAAQGLAAGDAVVPSAWGCNGQPVCTGFEVFALRSNGGQSANKTIDGVTGTFSRPAWQSPGAFSGYELFAVGRALNAGNTIQGDAHPYLADFSVGFTSASADLDGPVELGGTLGDYGTFLDMWSGPDGSGVLLARAEVLPGEPYSGTLTVDAPGGTIAHSLVFGRFLVGDPGCVYEPYGSGISFPCLNAAPGNADNVRIEAVPEPSVAILVASGLAALSVGRARRRP
jgi:hypothetical protein